MAYGRDSWCRMEHVRHTHACEMIPVVHLGVAVMEWGAGITLPVAFCRQRYVRTYV